MGEKKYYTVKKHVVEEFQVVASSAKEARQSILEDPHLVTVLKITAKLHETKN